MPELARFFGIVVRMYLEAGAPHHAPLTDDMKHAIHSVTAVAVVAAYTLRVEFEDGTVQTINFEPVLRGELYGPLRDLALFAQVRIDPEVRTLVWPNGADFDPATLHDWPTYSAMLIAQAQTWELAQHEP